MLRKAYLEITNKCNLSCSFCHGTSRPAKFMSVEEFTHAATELRKVTEYLYFHLLGEPLLHPELPKFFEIADSLGFKVIITTNGTLLQKRKSTLLGAKCLHKVSVSLHSFEANNAGCDPAEYLDGCFDFLDESSNRGIISVMRLWNIGGEDKQNAEILSAMRNFFGSEWTEVRSGYRLKDKLFLEWGEKFEWPDENAECYSECHTCYGLRDQVGVLSDGRVVPCCLDADGVITLGNIFCESITDILASPRAVALKRSFENRRITEPLCQKCDFARRLK